MAYYTLLDAVNYVISHTGAAPVSNTTDPLPDVQSALLRINEALTHVQKKGWYFNTDYDVVLTPDAGTSEYLLPNGTLKILRSNACFLVPRQGKAYDPYNQTFTFTEDATVDLVMRREFIDIPDSAQDCVRFAAAREHILIELEDERKAAEVTKSLYAPAITLLNTEELRMRRHNHWSNPRYVRGRGRVRPYGRGRTYINPNFPGGGL
jgi:hypothetical protein